MMHEVVFLNEKKVNPKTFEAESDTKDMWYLDNEASNHMSDIKGKCTVRFVLKDGKKKMLNDVYYIPGLRSNIVSLDQATEAGCEVLMKNDTLTLYDRIGSLMV